MKTWLNKFILVALASSVFVSCKKDEVKTILVAGSAPVLTASATSLVLVQANGNNNAVTFTWTEASFGFDAAVMYSLQIAKGGTSFASASTTEVALSSIAPFSKAFKVIDFNRELLKIINYGTATSVEVRIKATVSANAPSSFSNVVSITCTAYRDLITYAFPSALNIAGNFQGWNPGAAPQIVNAGNGGYGGYEGYIVFNDPSPQFKMVKGDNWGAGDYGDAGGGNLGNGGNNFNLPSGGAGIAGLYLLRAHVPSMTWYKEKINTWGLIGSATPGGWGSDQDMAFNAATGVWSITLNLVAGEAKFRANDDWNFNFGDNNGDFKPEYGGSNLPIASAGNYTITLDIGTAGNYAYSVKKN